MLLCVKPLQAAAAAAMVSQLLTVVEVRCESAPTKQAAVAAVGVVPLLGVKLLLLPITGSIALLHGTDPQDCMFAVTPTDTLVAAAAAGAAAGAEVAGSSDGTDGGDSAVVVLGFTGPFRLSGVGSFKP